MSKHRHISIRVPWHDNGWSGTVCKNPGKNLACLALKGISQKRDDKQEISNCGKSLDTLSEDQYPCCINERGCFMAPFEIQRSKQHPYTESSAETHGHFDRTTIRQPRYSADAIPFRWMQRLARWDDSKNPYAPDFRDCYKLELDQSREPKLNFNTSWIQQRDNQSALLDTFFGHIKPQDSLCFFYAKQTPLAEDSRRVIVAVGRVNHVGESQEYKYSCDKEKAPLRALLWERMIQHSIRPDSTEGFNDGFLLPYHQALTHAEKNPELDLSKLVAFAPDDRRNEFSYVSEHVTHDGAIGALLSCAAALREASKIFPGPWARYQQWIDTELGRLWRLRGPCPGLGAALSAFGIEFGVLVAYELANHVGENDDPWPVVDKMFRNPKSVLSPASYRYIGMEHQQVWAQISDERRALLKLLSRFELTPDDAKLAYVEEERWAANIKCTDADILGNPYRLFEISRKTPHSISIATIDRGLFPSQIIRDKHPLPQPSRVDTATDIRRIRAWVIQTLEDAAIAGDTLLPRMDIINSIRSMPHLPECPVTGDLMSVAEKAFPPEVEIVPLADSKPAFQLSRLAACSSLIRTEVTRRINGKLHTVDADWLGLLAENSALGPVPPGDQREERSRIEKAAALNVLAESRISILIGSAGTGKTTLLAVLCGHESIDDGGVLLLAPTGKARVRMEQAAKKNQLNVSGQTVASYLIESNRYVPETGQYRMLGPTAPKGKILDTVIIDETSMLTEEMLASLLEAVGGAKRIILVGDHRQLPPIGAGRPFADLVKHLQPHNCETLFPRIGRSYAELTLNWRQNPSSPDARLASWFSGADPGPGEESVFRELTSFGPNDRLQIFSWNTTEECQTLLQQVLQTELKLSSANDVIGFDKTLGGTESKGHCYFNRSWEKGGVGTSAENWQILSPIKSMPYGVIGLNRFIHQSYRSKSVELSRKRWQRKTPEPLGPEEIVYGDKVINVRNQRRWWEIYPDKGCSKYVANGEIGIAVGQFKGPTAHYKGLPWKLEVEFTSQPAFTYGYTKRDFGEEGDAPLELAYALTVHKAQGSEFLSTIFVLPNPCRILTRELLYTALTRQRNRIVIMCQGDPSLLRNYIGSEHSETARRLTNLFAQAEPVVIKERRYDGKHIHRTKRNELVMSKSKVIIANELFYRGINYAYEKECSFGSGRVCRPDFTIEDAATGLTVYWEHCGMLMDKEYERRWELKLNWYRSNGVLPFGEGRGKNGVLVVTSDDSKSGFDTPNVSAIIDGLFGKA